MQEIMRCLPQLDRERMTNLKKMSLITNLKKEELDKLHEAVTEAQKIEQCFTCSNKIESAVLLRPCGHWFCKECIEQKHRNPSDKGKRLCPVCKTKADHRQLLPFHEKQREYADCLKTVIEAINRKLGIDITNIEPNKKTKGHFKVKDLGEENDESVFSPLRKTRTSRRVSLGRNKTDDVKCNQSKRLDVKTNKSSSPKEGSLGSFLTTSPPSTPVNTDGKVMKVKNWLESSKFSQAEDDVSEQVVVDVHRSEVDSPVTEDQLISVTQLDSKPYKPCFTKKFKSKPLILSPDIKSFDDSDHDESNSKLKKANSPIAVESDLFDEILPKKRKCQTITATYSRRDEGVKLKKRKVLQLDSDVFDPTETSAKESSQSSLEDFSSGSGEEWTADKNKKTTRKLNLLNPQIVKEKATNQKRRNSSSKNILENNSKRNTKTTICLKSGNRNHTNKINKGNKNVFETKEPIDNFVKTITDDWIETDPTNPCENQLYEEIDHKIKPLMESTPKRQKRLIDPSPKKQLGQKGSPGWSRLASTKKEFHMSDKKKLSLKTLNRSKSCSNTNLGIQPLGDPNDKKSHDEVKDRSMSDLKEISCDSINFSVVTKPNSEKRIANNVLETPLNCVNKNISSSSSTGSPFRGFTSLEIRANADKYLPMSVSNINLPSPIYTHKSETSCDKSTKVSDNTMGVNEVLSKNVNAKVTHDVSTSCENPITTESKENKAVPQNNDQEESAKAKEKCKENTFSINQKFNLKNDRDSGIHNISCVASPVKTKTFSDAEVQASPKHFEEFVKHMVERIWGKNVRDILENGIATAKTPDNVCKLLPNETLDCRSNLIHGQMCCDSTFKEIIRSSQDSDKENVCNQVTSTQHRFFNDSDIIMGTEDCIALQGRENLLKIIDENKNSNCKSKPVIYDFPNVSMTDTDGYDHDAPTQPYRTPLVPKPTNLMSSAKVFSAVSNPTASELKKVDTVFQNEDIIFPEETPKVLRTPWEDSGIDQLAELTTVKELDDHFEVQFDSTQKSKGKNNRSRRQLDFIAEDSSDMFEGVIGPTEHQEKTGSCESRESYLINCDKNDEMVEGTAKFDLKSDKKSPKNITECVVNAIDEIKNIEVLSSDTHKSDHVLIKDVPSTTDPEDDLASESSLIEGTPDVTQTNLQLNNDCQNYDKDPETPQANYADDHPEKTNSNASSDLPDKESHTDVGTEENVQPKTVDRFPKMNTFLENTAGVCESEDQEEEQTCFASSLLTPQQNQILHMLLAKFNIPFSKSVGPHITHLVVGTKDGRAQNTYKFLHAMALHKPIIRFEWVEEVLKLGRALPLDPFIALDSSGECGVLRAHQDTNRELLKDFAIHVYNTVEAIVQRNQIEELIRLCGGLVVDRLEQFHAITPDKFRVIVLSDALETQPGWREKYSAAEVSIDWVYNSIGRYRVAPLAKFMDESTDILSFLLRQGYPPHLIDDS